MLFCIKHLKYLCSHFAATKLLVIGCLLVLSHQMELTHFYTQMLLKSFHCGLMKEHHRSRRKGGRALRSEGGRDEQKRYFWLHSKMSGEADVSSWFAPFVTFCLEVLFKTMSLLRSCSCTNTQTDQKHTHTFAAKKGKKKTLASWFCLYTHIHAHTLGPSSPHPLSSQRHKDIFIFHKAQTLMKHWRHKYISMIFHIWLLPSLLWHTTAFLSAVVNINCQRAWESRWFRVMSDAFQW